MRTQSPATRNPEPEFMPDPLQQIETLGRDALAELELVDAADALEQYRIKYLGTKGQVKNLPRLIAQAAPEHKKEVGRQVNNLKQRLTEAFESRKAQLAASTDDRSGGGGGGAGIDITEPGLRPAVGRRHILMRVIDELTELFARMGFDVAEGPEVEDEFHNFIALNIPEQHPARDPLDNFYLAPTSADSAVQGNLRLLRTQTSTVQIRIMEERKPPIRVVIPGRVYRPDTHDMTHLSMFHQLEALVIDRNVSMVDLKSTILQFVKAYFGPETKVRFRPSFFPFTEPSAEVDVWFDLPDGKSRWIELGGCGMVHPNVLKTCKIDPEEYSGWAFGFGVERIAMRKYGINDIRLFVENDIRFLRQF
jgi:phenylalanyl-tRNA synthetase alpha chain